MKIPYIDKIWKKKLERETEENIPGKNLEQEVDFIPEVIFGQKDKNLHVVVNTDPYRAIGVAIAGIFSLVLDLVKEKEEE